MKGVNHFDVTYALSAYDLGRGILSASGIIPKCCFGGKSKVSVKKGSWNEGLWC